jgi:hypothetical protein
LPADTIVYTATDGACSISGTFVISQPSALAIGTTTTDVTCNGGCDGTATATVTGGTATYTYLWSDGQTTATATGLCAGTYTCVANDANGCVITDTVTITEPTAMVVVETTTNVTCNGDCDGTATVVATGGTAPYTYSWTGGQTTGLCAGVYTYTVTDANGCTYSADVTITEPDAVAGAITEDATSNKLEVTMSSGVSPYTYLWNTTETTASIVPTMSGIYWCVATDANGCVSDTMEIDYISTAVTELSIEAISIYPNPSDEIFTISFVSNAQQVLDVAIVSILGKVVYTENLENFIGALDNYH